MEQQWSPRIGWFDLPVHVKSGIERILGSKVVEATGQRGGFSPGTADRVLTAAGRRAFVKAVGPELNEHSPELHRKEAIIARALPEWVPAPSMLGSFDDGQWVALVFDDVEGRHPHVPWRMSELLMVLDALLELAKLPIPQELAHLPTLERSLGDDFNGWKRLRADPPACADPWLLGNLDLWERLAERGMGELQGRSLVHQDIRADNILLTQQGGALIVDWPWAGIGSPWFDALGLLVNVGVYDPAFDVDSVLGTHQVFDAATDEGIDGVLSGLGAYFLDAARQSPVPGLPTLRAFQKKQGDAVLSWLRQRLTDRGRDTRKR